VFEIGNSLREARLRQALEYADVERVTKVRPKYLRALEEEQFDSLPAQTYVKGFLRTYAEFLGLDGQLYVDEFNSRYVSREEEVPLRPRHSSAGRARSRRTESSVVLGALIGIAIVFALVIAAWKSGGDSTPDRPPAPAAIRPPEARDVVVRALRGTTGMEVHERSRAGELRWSGTLENGREQGFPLTRALWLYIQHPAAVDLLVSGRKVALPGRFVGVSLKGAVTRAPQH
jgi:cytoskeleton protein RodZ